MAGMICCLCYQICCVELEGEERESYLREFKESEAAKIARKGSSQKAGAQGDTAQAASSAHAATTPTEVNSSDDTSGEADVTMGGGEEAQASSPSKPDEAKGKAD